MTIIASAWNLGKFWAFEPENVKRILRLGYLDTMKAFGAFSGKKYTFLRGQFAGERLEEADAAAAAFELDPAIIYSKEVLDQKLLEAVNQETSRQWKEDVKSKVKRFLTDGPGTLLEEEILAKRYVVRNGILW